MQMQIYGHAVTALPGQTLLDLVRQLGLDSDLLSQRPLAAKLAGEVFNLNYIPVRVSDVCHDRASIRSAMAASGGQVQLLRYSDPSGKDVYGRTVQFLLFLAIHQLWPEARASMNCTLGSALYVDVQGAWDFSAWKLKERFSELVAEDFPLIRRRTTTQAAIEQYAAQGKEDKAKLLQYRKQEYFDQYAYGDFADYYYGELVPSSGYVKVWDIQPARGGFLFVYPDDLSPDTVADYQEMPNFMAVSNESESWCRLMECRNVADLNELTKSGKIRELIRVNEALHEKRYGQVADMICQRGAKAVLLAGPSSSGKTTSANRLATQLRVHGKKPILMGLDDYYIDRELIPYGPD